MDASVNKSEWAALVLTGGTSRRLGRDKSVVTVAGVTLLDRILETIPGDVPVVVVGPSPQRPSRPVRVTREIPPGGGPVAGIAAGLRLVDTPVVAVIAADMPFAGGFAARLARDLADAIAGRVVGPGSSQPVPDALIPVDLEGQRQALCAAYRTSALKSAMTTQGDPAGRSVRSLLGALRVADVPAPADPGLLLDVDTASDLSAARRRVKAMVLSEGRGDPYRTSRGVDHMLSDWVAAARGELGIDAEIDVDVILDVAKDVAHGVARPAAPVTTYLLGLAVAAGADVESAAAKIRQLVASWPREQ